MARLVVLLMVGCALLPAPALAFVLHGEITTATISSPIVAAKSVMHRVQSSLDKGEKPVIWELSKEARANFLNTRVSVGKGIVRHPIDLKVWMTTTPSISRDLTGIDKEIFVTASRPVNQNVPGNVELGYRRSDEQVSSLWVLYKVNL